ncbi:hypothetical protein L208DRAFT_651357 [Tricholoma matsutake]|nr:hypothetical protein L208DRAFT_651357 [Tricholoma matsutake 945]
MSFHAARHVFSATARSSVRLHVNACSIRMGAKRMNSSHAPKQSSDRPWIIASALIFGPAFLYLISPSARKPTHLEHHDLHDVPGHQKSTAPEPAQESEPVTVKDEDKDADAVVTEAVDQAETNDEPVAIAAEPSASTSQPASEESTAESKDDAQSTTENGEGGPADLTAARQASKEGKVPKQKAEESSS